MELGIKFHPIRPASPHLNGKVKRSQQTDLREFYSFIDLKAHDLEDQLQQWQHDYNWHRPLSGLGGKALMDRVCELSALIPLREEVEALYDPEKESIQEQNYHLNLQLKKTRKSKFLIYLKKLALTTL